MNKSIADNIREKIHTHSISMRPRAYFVVGSVLLGIGLAASVLVATFFIAVTIFRLRVNAPFAYLQTHNGLGAVVDNMPLLPILIAIAGIALGMLFMRKYDFSHKHAFFGVAGGFLIAVGIFGIIIDATGLPEQAEQLETLRPLLHTKYENETWVAGTIVTVGSDALELQTPNGLTYVIIITDETNIIPSTILQEGEWALISGDREDGQFAAEQITHRPSPRRTLQFLHKESRIRLYFP